MPLWKPKGMVALSSSCASSSSRYKIVPMAKTNKPHSSSASPKGSDPVPPRITSNVKQNLQILKFWKEFQKRKSSTPKPATSYRKKKVEKEDLPEDLELYRDPTLSLYYTNQIIDNAVPVLLVDGYNVCGYWPKLKKHFVNGRLDVARQKLVDELITFSVLREVKVVVVFDAMMSGLPNHKETFGGVDIVYSAETCADAWIEKEVVALREDGCPKVWVVTSDRIQQHAAHGAVDHNVDDYFNVDKGITKGGGTNAKRAKRPVNPIGQEPHIRCLVPSFGPTSFQGRLLKHNLDSEVVDALKDLRNKLAEEELRRK